MPYRELEKLLTGNRVTLPKEFVAAAKMKEGDPLIVEWDRFGTCLLVKPASVKAKKPL